MARNRGPQRLTLDQLIVWHGTYRAIPAHTWAAYDANQQQWLKATREGWFHRDNWEAKARARMAVERDRKGVQRFNFPWTTIAAGILNVTQGDPRAFWAWLDRHGGDVRLARAIYLSLKIEGNKLRLAEWMTIYLRDRREV